MGDRYLLCLRSDGASVSINLGLVALVEPSPDAPVQTRVWFKPYGGPSFADLQESVDHLHDELVRWTGASTTPMVLCASNVPTADFDLDEVGDKIRLIARSEGALRWFFGVCPTEFWPYFHYHQYGNTGYGWFNAEWDDGFEKLLDALEQAHLTVSGADGELLQRIAS